MANIYDMTDVWNDGATTFTSIKMNATDTASAADSKLLDLQVGSSSKVSVDKAGKITATDLQVDNVNVNSNTISSTTGNLVLDPYSGAKISLDGLLWPNADGTANQMLQTDGAGNLSWGTPAAGYSDSDVDTHLNTGSATSGQTLQWNGTDYAWGTPASSYGDSDVNANLNTSAATTNQVLSWNGTDYAWVAQTGGDLVTDTTPQLGGALDVNGNAITSTSAGNIAITPDTTGSVVLDGQSWPQADGTANQVLQTNGSGQLSWVTYSGATGYGDNDVDLHLNRSSATSGQVLGWNGTDYAWVANSGGSSYTDSDVDTHLNQSNPTSGYVLSWNGTDYAWVAQTTAYTDASVDTHLNQSNPTSGYVLSWNGSDYAWVAQTTAYTDSSVDAHLNQSNPTSGYVLSWNGTDYAWVAQAGITDVVDDTTPQLGGNLDLNTNDITGTGNINITGNATLTGYLAGPATFTIDPSAVGDNTGTVVIAGDLQVDGTTTTINSATLTVDDKNIVVASGAVNAAAADGAGLTVDGASATFTYAATGDNWTANKPLDLGANDLLADHIKATGDGTNNGKMDLQCSAGTHAVTLEGPDHSGASSYTLKLPQTAPTAGQVLAQNSNNDQLEFIDVVKPNSAAALTSLTTQNGSNSVSVRQADVRTDTGTHTLVGGASLYYSNANATYDTANLTAGDIVTIYCESGTVTVNTGGTVSLFKDGEASAVTAAVTIGADTIATVTCVSATKAIIAGSDLT